MTMGPVLVREGHCLNRKQVQHLWREEGLRVPSAPQAPAPWDLDHAGRPPHCCPPDHVWAPDYQFDVTATGRVIKILHEQIIRKLREAGRVPSSGHRDDPPSPNIVKYGRTSRVDVSGGPISGGQAKFAEGSRARRAVRSSNHL